MTVLIGDVHGKYRPYKNIIKSCWNSIQVGDMGVGFLSLSRGEPHYATNPPYDRMVEGEHRFIRGNHDNPRVCQAHTQCIPDGTIQDDVMFIGGALSIDRAFRMEGVDWWPEEELSIQRLNMMVDDYIRTRPRVMITHDCPEDMATEMGRHCGQGKLNFPSRTRQAFQAMWSAHSPELWIFGHWHKSFDQIANGTRFICLAELEARDIDIGLD